MKITVVLVLSSTLGSGAALACGDATGHVHGSGCGHAAGRPADASPSESAVSHGGDAFRRGDVLYEVVMEAGELRVYAYDGDGRPLDLRGTSGVVAPLSGGACNDSPVALGPLGTSGSGPLTAFLPERSGEPPCDEFRISLRGAPSRAQSDVTILWSPVRTETSPPRDGARHAH